MADIFNIVFPVFALSALGYVLIRFQWLADQTGDALAAFVFNVAIPVLLFRSLATANFAGFNPAELWLSYLPGILGAFAFSYILVAWIVRRGARAAVIGGVAAGFSNLVLMGIPLIERAYGEEGLALHFLLISVHLPFMMMLCTFLMEFAARRDGADTSTLNAGQIVLRVGKSLLINPLAIGILGGVAWFFSGLSIPAPALQIFDLIGRTAGPLALIALGMGFTKYSIRGNWQPAVGLALFSVVGMPLIALAAGLYVFDLPPLWLKVCVLAAACPTGVNAYLFATHFKHAEGLASSSIVFASLFSITTIPLWLALLASY